MGSKTFLEPSSTLAPLATSPTIPEQINNATRRHHVKLNALIVERLKLALPPKARDPRLLGHGLAAFSRIYFTFEDSWDKLILSEFSSAQTGKHDVELRSWVGDLRVQGLGRSSRLADDLAFISSRTQSCIENVVPAQRPKLERMATSIHENPHVLVAYAWVMYMATFAGGRWIRQQLFNAGPEFWLGADQWAGGEIQPFLDRGTPGFSFLSFDGDQDGENIKAEFKSRLLEAEALLTQEERTDIVVAAVDLFEFCIALVEDVDRAIWWKAVMPKRSSLFLFAVTLLASLWLLFGHEHFNFS